MSKNTAAGFRSDINGLRAWAVVAVILFHFELGGVSGGFAGVDVFFVISGFLMTSIIVKGLEGGNLSLMGFYLARARRIIPALLVLVFILLALGWFSLPMRDYKALGVQSIYSLLFVSNISFWRSAGYFDTDALEKWLLHTWSLSVEWQFYIVFPLMLLLLWKVYPTVRALRVGVMLLFSISLAISLFLTPVNADAAFYLLPARAWEMAAGGMVFLLTRQANFSQGITKACEILGWPLLLISFFLFSNTLSWPGVWAVFPVLGAALILIARNERSVLVAGPAIQWLGNRSYSLYLWHWPLAVALNFAGISDFLVWKLAAVCLSLVLAHFSYHLVENPARHLLSNNRMPRLAEMSVIALSVALVGVVALSIRLMEFDGRLPANVEAMAKEGTNVNPNFGGCFLPENGAVTTQGCIHGTGPLGAIVVGDSHALSVFSSIGGVAETYGKSVVLHGKSACSPLQQYDGGAQCRQFNEWAYEELNNYASDIPVILVGRFNFKKHMVDESTEFTRTLVDTTCSLAKTHPVYLLRPVPEMPVHVPNVLARELLFGRESEDITVSLNEYHRVRAPVWAAQDEAVSKCGVSILDPLPYLCDEEKCFGSRDGWPNYFDDDHLSETGNRYLMPMFEEIFEKNYPNREQ